RLVDSDTALEKRMAGRVKELVAEPLVALSRQKQGQVKHTLPGAAFVIAFKTAAKKAPCGKEEIVGAMGQGAGAGGGGDPIERNGAFATLGTKLCTKLDGSHVVFHAYA